MADKMGEERAMLGEVDLDEMCTRCDKPRGAHYANATGPSACPTGEILHGPHPTDRFTTEPVAAHAPATPPDVEQIIQGEIASSTGPTGGWLDSPKAVCASIIQKLREDAPATAGSQREKCRHCGRDVEQRNGEWRHVMYNGAYCTKPAEPAASAAPQKENK